MYFTCILLQTEKEVDNLNAKLKALTESNKTEKLMSEIKKLQ